MYLSRSSGRKALATIVCVVALVPLYESHALDSWHLTGTVESEETPTRAIPGAPLNFSVTAYCKGSTTASGANVKTGMAASDPAVLPVGSIIQVDRLDERHNGVYTVMDTGPQVQGRELDLYMWSCNEALALGRRDAAVTVVRLGWNPRATSQRVFEKLFGKKN
jgi:3D (Asp-Asp-Asp) domain-containing protein